MQSFSDWFLQEAGKKAKVAPVAHTDIDRWLKSVDGLAKELNMLKTAKDKAKTKISQIGQKYNNPENDKKSDEDEKDDQKDVKGEKRKDEKPVQLKPVEKEKKEMPEKKPKPDTQPEPKRDDQNMRLPNRSDDN